MRNHTTINGIKFNPLQMEVMFSLGNYRKVFSDQMDETYTKRYMRSIKALHKKGAVLLQTAPQVHRPTLTGSR